jgi:hypothetical protein
MHMVTEELQHVLGEARASASPPDIGLATFRVDCADNAPVVLACAREALACVLGNLDSLSSDLAFWRSVLPPSFLERFGPERTEAEAAAMLNLPVEERLRLPWTLSGWLYWFTSEERQWYWWDAWCDSSSTIIVEVEPVDWPFAHGALDWLFQAAGARSIEEQEIHDFE